MPDIVRPLQAGDRDAVRRILESTRNFTAVEIGTALELVDEWLRDGEASGYLTYVVDTDAARDSGVTISGYVCFGPAPLTEGTYDLYWIAVDPAAQGRGFGQRLLRYAEDEIRTRGGLLLLIETASQEAYGPTIRFYERAGYDLEARIRGFYRPGDDKLVYAKRLADA